MDKPKRKNKPGAGRPKGSILSIDMDELMRWARAGSTIPEAAQRLGVSLATLNVRLTEPEYRLAWEKAQAELKISLRSKQVQLALAGDRTMLIWLGKQFLGQKEPYRVEMSGVGDSPIELNVSARDQLLSRIASIAPGK